MTVFVFCFEQTKGRQLATPEANAALCGLGKSIRRIGEKAMLLRKQVLLKSRFETKVVINHFQIVNLQKTVKCFGLMTAPCVFSIETGFKLLSGRKRLPIPRKD